MFAVEVYAAVRHFVFVEGNSRREAARVFGLSRETVLKMCRFSLPPGYTRTKPVAKPKLGALLPVIGVRPWRWTGLEEESTPVGWFSEREPCPSIAATASPLSVSSLKSIFRGSRFTHFRGATTLVVR